MSNSDEIFNYLDKQGVSGLNEQQKQQITSGQEYLEKHNIQTLFQELLSQVIQIQPDNVQEFIAQLLRDREQEVELFYNENDFDALFENYNFLQENKVPVPYIIQALHNIGVDITLEEFQQKYPQYKEKDSQIEKQEFLQILNNLYKQNVISK